MVVIMAILGAMLGSFAAATVWRLRARQLASDAAAGYMLTSSEKKELATIKKLRGKKGAKDRSICLGCNRQLAWFDLIPVLSWLCLRGKCRTCQAPIGKVELLAELGLAAAMAVSYIAWPFGFSSVMAVALFVVWIVVLVLVTIHIIYDAKWFLLLDEITIVLTVCAVLFVALRTVGGFAEIATLPITIGGSLLVLPGLYWALYAFSKGGWIGFGDVKLLVPLAIMLPHWTEAVLALFLANLLGCIWIIPGMAMKKFTRKTRIPFGPFLIIGWVIAMLYGTKLVAAYLSGAMPL